jgi:PAS domain S-box-containing protein
MTLSQRTVLIIVSTFIALLFILAATSDLILLSSYSELEKTEIISRTQHISNQITDKLKQLDMSAREVSEHFQKTSRFVSNTGRTSTSIFSEYFFRSHSLDIAAVYDGQGHVIDSNGFNCEKNTLAPLTDEQKEALARLVSKTVSGNLSTVPGVTNLAGAPLMVALLPIKDINRRISGIVVVGWFIDNAEMERIFRASGTSIAVYDLKEASLPDVGKAIALIKNGETIHTDVIDNKSVAGYFILKDIFGKSSFIVRAIEKRLLYEHGKVTITYIFVALLITGAVFCSVMLLFVRGTILNRLQNLTRQVRQIAENRNISIRIPASIHNDECNILISSINSMLDSLELAETAMRDSEERYRMLFERAPDAIIIIGVDGDEAGRIVAANQAAADQHGYTLDEICSLGIKELNTPETNKIAGSITSSIISGQWLISEVWHQKKDGTQFPIEIHAGLIKIGGKNYILGFDRDITQRKIAEEMDHMYLEQIRLLNHELNRKAIDLLAVNNELETFNYSVSHDMRGPLTRISGYCQMLLDDDTNLDPLVREYITRIYESETWLNDMIDALLHIAQLTSIEIGSDSVNLSEIAEATLSELALEHPERSVKVLVEPDIVVSGDLRLLKMVMINLLSNAWKYSSRKCDAIIEVGVKQTEEGSVYYVRDNGAGFEMKDVGKIFRVFTRLHDSSQFDGIGIGLATVQRIIFRHGGRIWAEAETGVGATFFFTLA